MKKTINIPKINIVAPKKKQKINFPGYPVDTPTGDLCAKNHQKLLLIQRMFQNRKTNW
jgi:hypothetical protein